MIKPPFQITSKILSLVAELLELCGELKSFTASKPSVQLRKQNKIRTVHHSLAIEGNSLSEEQVTAILENKRVLGPKNQIIEIQNALEIYDSLNSFDPVREKDLMRAHKLLMHNLIQNPGRYRSTQVGVFKGSKVSHVAPPSQQVPKLMGDLFFFLKNDKETPWVVKACIFHYELEFIHPFSDGNGRMGRLWQQLILMKQSTIFEYISAESLIHSKQTEYYQVLEKCDKAGESTHFIEFSLAIILSALKDFISVYEPKRIKENDRISMAIDFFVNKSFSRKDYLQLHKGLSTATASRDLQMAVDSGLFKKTGDKALTKYRA